MRRGSCIKWDVDIGQRRMSRVNDRFDLMTKNLQFALLRKSNNMWLDQASRESRGAHASVALLLQSKQYGGNGFDSLIVA